MLTPTPDSAVLDPLLTLVGADPAWVKASAGVGETGGPAPQVDLAAPAAAQPFVVANLAKRAPVLAVTATTRAALDLRQDLTALMDPEVVAEFPAWETLPHERLSPRSDTVGQRLAVLRRLAHPETGPDAAPGTGPVQVVVASVRSLLQPIAAGWGQVEPLALRAGQEYPLELAVDRLAALGYSRVEMVTKRGEFAVRGGLIDVFAPVQEHPLRVEFWGDEVEQIRPFAVADQRGLEGEKAGQLWAPACRELLLTDAVRSRAQALIPAYPGLTDLLDAIASGVAVEGMESLAGVLCEQMQLLPEVMPPSTQVVVCDPERVRTRSHDLVATSQEFLAAAWSAAAMGSDPAAQVSGPRGGAPIELGAGSYRTYAQVRELCQQQGRGWWTVTAFATDEELAAFDMLDVEAGVQAYTLSSRPAPQFHGDTQAAFAQLRQWLQQPDPLWVVVVTPGQGSAQRLVEKLGEEGIAARLESGQPTRTPGVVSVVVASVMAGLVSSTVQLALITQNDLVGQRSSTRDMRTMPSRRRHTIDPLQLQAGDLVVHEHHGVGRYVEMVARTVGSGAAATTREYLVLEYAPSKRGQPGDRLFVPTDQLDQITRYVGGENPALDRLGGGDWAKRKSRARKAVRDIAAGLIQLYSARMATPGHTFAPDTPWQRELEDAFPYAETPDQLSTIDEVKADMEKPVPMDRVVCGDVGYGKTEIAVRAAFKAIQDGKQVALLVPTTLLVQQHLSTFSERYATFPVTVRGLSRFQTDAQAKKVLEGMADGSVDLVIGTHRLLGQGVKFKDLGLVIVDEEQRFGVEHKEHLKAMRTAVDVLTMSATPIPRTLEMSITGIREMSTIQTPPEERQPVLTFVGAYDTKQVAAAIRRELLRDGQVFFLHNRVESIDSAARKLSELVPEARIATAHGQMNEHALEQVVLDFWQKKFDVLVCTTIVESGLDISNANTLIVEHADRYGLSQLHQLRGRVGRGRERAYAYFTYSADKPLSETAYDRLTTIAQNTDLGSGMAVAMKDLEIRGAGNLLGGEQSGHIADVGFDLYVRLVGEAVSDFKRVIDGEPVAAPVTDVSVELPIDAHLPHEYVPGERLRLEAYRKIAAVDSPDGLEAVREELNDRYGPLPRAVDNLLAVARFRLLARGAGVSEVALAGAQVRVSGLSLPESMQVRLRRLYPRAVHKPAAGQILIPLPREGGATGTLGGQPLRDTALLDWCTEFITSMVPAVAATPATA